MNTNSGASLMPHNMTLPAICDHMRAAGKMKPEKMLQELESAIKCHTHWHVRFAERPIICGCDFPQVVPRSGSGELELKYHLQDGIQDGNESLVHFINQIAILTVLTTLPEETVCSLNPDTAMDKFLNKNPEYGHLVHEVATTLNEITAE